MENTTKKEAGINLIIGLIFSILFIFIMFAPTIISTKIEQNTFNKFSETKATFIEALFTELRVIPN